MNIHLLVVQCLTILSVNHTQDASDFCLSLGGGEEPDV